MSYLLGQPPFSNTRAVHLKMFSDTESNTNMLWYLFWEINTPGCLLEVPVHSHTA